MARKRSRRESQFHGIVVVDKPAGMTSQDVVDVVRRAAGTRRVGHTGTLDPLATGLLILLLGEATKLSEYLMAFDKEYVGTMRLGVESDTYDVEGTLVPHPDRPVPGAECLRELAKPLTGDIMQTPPPYSAVKIAGRKLYEYAREGEKVDAEARPVQVKAFEVGHVTDGEAGFRVACSSGTYVRSLVHELGQAAGCGAVVATLRRSGVGDYTLEEAIPLDTLRRATPETFGEFVAPMVDALTSWPVFHLGEGMINWIRRGQAIPASLARWDPETGHARLGDAVFLCPEEGDALAVAKVMAAPPSRPPAALARQTGFWLQPVKLLGPGEGEEPKLKDEG